MLGCWKRFEQLTTTAPAIRTGAMEGERNGGWLRVTLTCLRRLRSDGQPVLDPLHVEADPLHLGSFLRSSSRTHATRISRTNGSAVGKGEAHTQSARFARMAIACACWITREWPCIQQNLPSPSARHAAHFALRIAKCPCRLASGEERGRACSRSGVTTYLSLRK